MITKLLSAGAVGALIGAAAIAIAAPELNLRGNRFKPLAYEQLKDTMQRYRDDSPRARAAIAAAKRRLALLNRALAIIALEAAQQPA